MKGEDFAFSFPLSEIVTFSLLFHLDFNYFNNFEILYFYSDFYYYYYYFTLLK